MEQHTGMAEAYIHRTHTARWREREFCFFCWFRKCVFFSVFRYFLAHFLVAMAFTPARERRVNIHPICVGAREKFKSSPNIMHLHGLQDCVNQSHSRRVFLKINQTLRWIFTFHLALAHPFTTESRWSSTVRSWGKLKFFKSLNINHPNHRREKNLRISQLTHTVCGWRWVLRGEFCTTWKSICFNCNFCCCCSRVPVCLYRKLDDWKN